MTNGEKAGKLLGSAGDYLRFMETALADGSWNVVVREAAEAVELNLKGILSYLLVDYPRVHDVGRFFVGTVTARGIGLREQEAVEVRAASSWLGRKGAPAFYFDFDETAVSAAEAAAHARRVHELCLRIMADVGGEESGA